jgi:hypothetical protein
VPSVKNKIARARLVSPLATEVSILIYLSSHNATCEWRPVYFKVSEAKQITQTRLRPADTFALLRVHVTARAESSFAFS